MPILEENKHRYPKNWKEISERIRFVRADNKCEVCGIPNYSIGYRDKEGKFIHIENSHQGDANAEDAERMGFKIIKIVLTVAHLDHIPENCEDENLKAMCQKCHNNYDKSHRKQTIRTRKEKTQPKLNL